MESQIALVKSIFSRADTSNPSEINIKIPIKKHVQHPTRSGLYAGITNHNMLFVGPQWYALDEICWVNSYPGYPAHTNMQFPHQAIKYSYLIDSLSFNPSGSQLLAVVRTSLVVDGIVRGLFETELDSDDVERGDCKVCFILINLKELDNPISDYKPGYRVITSDGKDCSFWPDELAYIRWITDDVVYYYKFPIILSPNSNKLDICRPFDILLSGKYRAKLAELKEASAEIRLFAACLTRSYFDNFTICNAYIGHHVFSCADNSQTFSKPSETSSYLYYVDTETIYCHTIPMYLIKSNYPTEKIKTVKLALKDVPRFSQNQDPITGKQCDYFISHAEFKGDTAILKIANSATKMHVRFVHNPEGGSLVDEPI